MNEKSQERPYEEIPGEMDKHHRPLYTNGWQRARPVSTEIYRTGSGGKPLPVGPGTFNLGEIIPNGFKTIEVKYEFEAGREAGIQAAEEGAPVYQMHAPEGYVIIPVGAARQWLLHLPAGTSVYAFIDKWQRDPEAISRFPQRDATEEELERGRKALARVVPGYGQKK